MTRRRLSTLGLLFLIGLVAPALAAEQRCTELGVNCLCSEPMNTTSVIWDGQNFYDFGDSTTKQCGVEFGGQWAVKRQSPDLFGSNDAVVLGRLPRRTPALQFFTRQGNNTEGDYETGHTQNYSWNNRAEIAQVAASGQFRDLGDGRLEQIHNAKIAARWYRYLSDDYTLDNFGNNGQCTNAGKFGGVDLLQGTGSAGGPAVYDFGWNLDEAGTCAAVGLPAGCGRFSLNGLARTQLAEDCCDFGPIGSGGTLPGASGQRGKWWFFEFVVENRFTPGFRQRIYARNVTDDGPELLVSDSNSPNGGDSATPAIAAAGQAGTLMAADINATGAFTTIMRSSNYRGGDGIPGNDPDCLGWAGMSHFMVAQWPTLNDPATGQPWRIGPAYEVEGGEAQPPDTTPPSQVTGVSATGQSGQVTLTWTAATDNIGIDGYNIERCTGAGCASFAQVATLGAVTSYVNTGLANSTVYQYRLKARDIAGNLSASYSVTVSATTSAPSTGSPYPPSTVLASPELATHFTVGEGSDMWPFTWHTLTDQYSAWGDGTGCDAFGDDVFWGIARVTGNPPGITCTELAMSPPRGDFSQQETFTNKKIMSIVSNGGSTLYGFWVSPGDGWTAHHPMSSHTNGASWSFDNATVLFDAVTDGVTGPYFIQFGPGYTGVPSPLDSTYFYFYLTQVRTYAANFQAGTQGPNQYLCRAPRATAFTRSTYECVTAINASNVPTWGPFANRIPVFVHHADTTEWWFGLSTTYHPGLGRYVASAVTGVNKLGIFDAPTPWGPWTTMYYSDAFIDGVQKMTPLFPQKWMTGTSSMWMVLSGFATPEWDKMHLLRFTLSGDSTPPAPPTGVTIQ